MPYYVHLACWPLPKKTIKLQRYLGIRYFKHLIIFHREIRNTNNSSEILCSRKILVTPSQYFVIVFNNKPTFFKRRQLSFHFTSLSWKDERLVFHLIQFNLIQLLLVFQGQLWVQPYQKLIFTSNQYFIFSNLENYGASASELILTNISNHCLFDCQVCLI